MLRRQVCGECSGSGVVVIETKQLWGLMSKETPTSCTDCGGRGSSWELEQCSFCEGRGLMGNESEVCRSCNGTGHADTFAFIPRELLTAGMEFQRRCERCNNHTFRLASDVRQQKIVRSWDAIEELRQVEYKEACDVECTGCGHRYMILVDPRWHVRLEQEHYAVLEDRGFDLGFLYQRSS